MARWIFACRGFIIPGVLVILAGCGNGTALEREGIAIQVPQEWEPMAVTTWPVPGTVLAAWRGPGRSSLVIYTSLAIPNPNRDALGVETYHRLVNLTGLKVNSPEKVIIDGNPAVRLDVEGPGSGDQFASSSTGKALAHEGSALEQTHRVLISIPRQGTTIHLVWHAPVTSVGGLKSAVDATLAGLRLRADRASQSDTY